MFAHRLSAAFALACALVLEASGCAAPYAENPSTTPKSEPSAATSVVDYEEIDKLSFRYEMTGNLSNNGDAYVSTVPISVIMRNEAGAIVSGCTGAAYRVKAGRTRSFLITMNTAPDHARVEVYPHPWEKEGDADRTGIAATAGTTATEAAQTTAVAAGSADANEVIDRAGAA